jgi:hypothetical protein
MKTVYLNRDYYYSPQHKLGVAFKAGVTYSHVLDQAAQAIERDGAGHVLAHSADAVDASEVWKKFGARIKNGRRGR